jgi:hypothetical protein
MKITMAHKQAALKIKHWYLIYSGVMEFAVKGTETFTLFDKMSERKQQEILDNIYLNPSEIPVLVLTTGNERFIVNTSERFIKITPGMYESIYYKIFDGFAGHEVLSPKKILPRLKRIIPKTELGFKIITGEIIFWKIPVGEASYAFWNVTRQVEIIRITD